jgi:hypothetical protein
LYASIEFLCNKELIADMGTIATAGVCQVF